MLLTGDFAYKLKKPVNFGFLDYSTVQEVLSLGAKLAVQGFTVILNAKYDGQSLRAAVIDLAQSEGIQLDIIHCTAPECVLLDRLAQRTGDIADATADLLASQQQAWEDFTPVEEPYVTRIDTTVDSLIQPLLEKLALSKLRN